MEQLANELNARRQPPVSADEAYILGGDEAPAIAELLSRHRNGARAPPTCRWRRKNAGSGKESGWGFFGRKKAPRPICAPNRSRRVPAPRRRRRQAALRRKNNAAPPSGEDLFPEHSRDEQFEIPAFLRRQSADSMRPAALLPIGQVPEPAQIVFSRGPGCLPSHNRLLATPAAALAFRPALVALKIAAARLALWRRSDQAGRYRQRRRPAQRVKPFCLP